ncbi:MAG: 3-phosphoshikimate 1-carboxyvinyltransferase [Verrucomicrobiota bacterium]|nr:3-phosphoshikimate 1-carboxyvinyltransferase [Verrucomicrobiota bacterium]
MKFKTQKSSLTGNVRIPGSKSHTIRAVLIASLAEGTSYIKHPLVSSDTLSAINIYQALGAEIIEQKDCWVIKGVGKNVLTSQKTLDVGNSGTTLRLAMGSVALFADSAKITLTGDKQICSRPIAPLIKSLNQLGADIFSPNGCAPVTISGKICGGKTQIECQSSQYLTSLLMACPLAENDTEIIVPILNEKPYVQMTLDWLQKQGIKLTHNPQMTSFYISGGQKYKAFSTQIPADFSTATFFLCAGAIKGNSIICSGLDLEDTQGDKKVVEYLKRMGTDISVHTNGNITVKGGELNGIDIDMNETPDALPMMAVTACFAKGKTKLYNVAQARIKETDRIKVMMSELKKMGADIEELPDGLIITGTELNSADVCGHSDHRVVMALTIAGMMTAGSTVIDSAESANITFPEFKDFIEKLNGQVVAIK